MGQCIMISIVAFCNVPLQLTTKYKRTKNTNIVRNLCNSDQLVLKEHTLMALA